MAHQYIIRIETTDDDGVIETQFLTKANKTAIFGALLDACDARDSAQKWVKGKYTICLLQELTNV